MNRWAIVKYPSGAGDDTQMMNHGNSDSPHWMPTGVEPGRGAAKGVVVTEFGPVFRKAAGDARRRPLRTGEETSVAFRSAKVAFPASTPRTDAT
ncbi:MAG: hypothetical protein JW741_13095, partial [Sedimentisphaerales bacterium]|nr:hypothetical protein [Sedimentisphaerales bacterium]